MYIYIQNIDNTNKEFSSDSRNELYRIFMASSRDDAIKQAETCYTSFLYIFCVFVSFVSSFSGNFPA